MSDGTKPTKVCALCGKEPTSFEVIYGAVLMGTERRCNNENCALYLIVMPSKDWDALHEGITAALKEAFKAGHAVAVHGERGSGKMDWDREIYTPMLYGEYYGDEEYNGVDAFEYWQQRRLSK
jgi:hypothetical protein